MNTTRFILRVLLIMGTMLAIFPRAVALAQEIAGANESAYNDLSAPEAPLDIIFSNLGPRSDPYNTGPASVLPVAGKNSSTDTEQWQAVRFSPKVDVQAKVLLAALGWVSGERLIKIGLYDNNEISNTVGTLLPGGEGSTADIPEVDECCQLARVTLGGEGVTLFAGEIYWLVLSPDNVNGPTFTGRWHLSNLAMSAGMAPPLPWGIQPGQWPAAEIRGTRLQTAEPNQAAKSPEVLSSEAMAPAAKITIFSNLDRTGSVLYLYGTGSVLAGDSASSSEEVWRALPFTPRRAVRAKTLAAAVGWTAGTKKVNLGLYSDSGGTVGAPLPGGQGSTTDIPTTGICCELTKVGLPGAGIDLAAGVQVWLVASPDNENAPDFFGEWQHSVLAVRAYRQPEFFIGWTSVSGGWPAAEIRGTSP